MANTRKRARRRLFLSFSKYRQGYYNTFFLVEVLALASTTAFGRRANFHDIKETSSTVTIFIQFTSLS